MNASPVPAGHRFERLHKSHSRKGFTCGEAAVDDWLRTKALQNQDKHLSATTVLLDSNDSIVGFYTLATGQIDFGDLPAEAAKGLPKRLLPVAVIAWLGVGHDRHGEGLGTLLVASALKDCFVAGRTFAFVAVVLDCLHDAAKAFYTRFDFRECPGYPYKLVLSANQLGTMMAKPTTP